MMAYAMHLLRTLPAREVRVHPDGEHGKQFPFEDWLRGRGFERRTRTGKTSYGGRYEDGSKRSIVVNPKSVLGDVVAEANRLVVSAECKGAIINTRHSGQVSKLDKGLCEVVGRLLAVPSPGRQVAVVPYTHATLRLATKLALRCGGRRDSARPQPGRGRRHPAGMSSGS
jgi:hypothetical protein